MGIIIILEEEEELRELVKNVQNGNFFMKFQKPRFLIFFFSYSWCQSFIFLCIYPSFKFSLRVFLKISKKVSLVSKKKKNPFRKKKRKKADKKKKCSRSNNLHQQLPAILPQQQQRQPIKTHHPRPSTTKRNNPSPPLIPHLQQELPHQTRIA